jgi:transposase-like protein
MADREGDFWVDLGFFYSLNDEAALKLIYLALRNITKKWKMSPITWRAAKTQFAILFGERFTDSV